MVAFGWQEGKGTAGQPGKLGRGMGVGTEAGCTRTSEVCRLTNGFCSAPKPLLEAVAYSICENGLAAEIHQGKDSGRLFFKVDAGPPISPSPCDVSDCIVTCRFPGRRCRSLLPTGRSS